MADRKLQLQIYFNNNDERIIQSFKENALFVCNLFGYYLPPVVKIKARKIVADFLYDPDEYARILDDFNSEVANVDGAVITVYNPKDRGVDGIREEIKFLTTEVMINI